MQYMKQLLFDVLLITSCQGSIPGYTISNSGNLLSPRHHIRLEDKHAHKHKGEETGKCELYFCHSVLIYALCSKIAIDNNLFEDI